jgi:hypothetical protein
MPHEAGVGSVEKEAQRACSSTVNPTPFDKRGFDSLLRGKRKCFPRRRSHRWLLVAPLIALGLAGCRYFGFEEREPWRAEAEEQCVAQGLVQRSSFMEMGSALNGNGACGMTRPFKVAAVNGGFVALEPKATLACPLVANVEAWFMEAVQPAAMAWFGSPVTEIKQISAYSCRTMNGQPGAPISEHAFGNALDVASFRFADGREVSFKDGWKGRSEERGFLRSVHAAACERFTTVLAPGADMFHYDHIHVDLARRASGRNVCKPTPMSPAPPPLRAPQPEGQAVARAPSPPASTSPWAQAASLPGSTSPWAQTVQQPARPAMRGPSVVLREPAPQSAGTPLVIANPAPPTNSFGTPLPIAERVRQALGTPAPTQAPAPVPMRQAPPPMQPPAPQPGYQNPYGLVPPARIPNARVGTDPVVTGSIAGTEKRKAGNGASNPEASLMDPRSIAEHSPHTEAASVFDLPTVAKGN